MSYLVDRRQNSKNKSAVNRQRFMRRHHHEIRRSLAEKLKTRSITDTDTSETINIPGKDTREPVFHHGRGGQVERIYPGNQEFNAGDQIARPKGGQGGGGKQASDQGEGLDEFAFEISQREFLDLLFEDLELPNLTRKSLVHNDEFKRVRAGFSTSGSPANVSIIRTMRAASARRIALAAGKRGELRKLLQEHEMLEQVEPVDDDRLQLLDEKIADLRGRINRVPFIDDFDLRYHQTVRQPVPRSKAVMFCVMDISGSMDQNDKDLSKRFFILLHLFLSRHYEKTEVVFVRHHTQAAEVDEQEFFCSRETGGTVVSSALNLVQELITDRFPLGEWNVYVAQASDGDNWPDDGHKCEKLLTDLLPQLQYYAYVELSSQEKPLWQTYAPFQQQHPQLFAMQHITGPADIYPVLRNLFKKQAA